MSELKNNKNKQNKKVVLLDAYAILHRAYHALPDFSSSKGEPTGALYGVSSMLLKIVNDFKPDYIVACYDLPKKTYRHEIYKDYKAGRKKPDEELISQIERSRDIFKVFNIPIYEKEGFEADDILGTIAEQLKEKDIDIIIASGDMDTLQLVDNKKVQVYTLKTGINNVILYDEKAVVDRFGFGPKILTDYKGLRGDSSDNIKGIKGIGDKIATTLIHNFGTIEDIYKKLEKDEDVFLNKGVKPRIINLLKENKEEAFFSKELATIQLNVPIKFILPKKIWKEEIDEEKIISLFQDLGFRTLLQRTRTLFFNQNENTEDSFRDTTSKSEDVEEEVGDSEFEKTAIALWVLDSNKTKTTIQEIKDYTQTKTFKEAKERIWKLIKNNELDFILKDIELPLIPIFKKMKENGIKLDLKYLKKLSIDYTKKLNILEKEIWKQSGEEFNINSPKQLSEILFEKMNLETKSRKKTSTGMRSTKESELQKMIEAHPIIGNILKYRELKKLLSTYIDSLPKLTDQKSLIHTTFLQTGTTTGRISSNQPNLQNIPIRTEQGRKIREAFKAQKGFSLFAFDYSQVELRVIAMLSGDKNMIKIFKQGADVHSAVASKIFGVPIEKVNEGMRRKAKTINFGMIYGMGVNSLRQNMEDASDGLEKITRKEAQDFYNKYFETFKTIADYLEGIKKEVLKTGYTKTFFGRLRYFEGIKSKIPFIKAMAERMAINAPVQGTSADILKIAMIRIDKYLVKNKLEDKIKILLQVHDELIFEIKEGAEEKHILKIKDIMETIIPLEKSKGIKFEVNIKKGDSWGEMKTLEHENIKT
ncbi:MAG: hypothetical protein KAS02_01290 [Candidatus Pacebacteria bacterium]|nr:hypothetical protein [Candidatus Paceibacterota bacterium]